MRLLRYLLAPLSPLYGTLIRARNRAFDKHPARVHKVDVPVLSVGNLSTGGTGKTPVTLFLATELQQQGWDNAVLSRGYGGRRSVDPMDVSPDSDPSMTGDEPLMLARSLGPGRVVVGRSRHAAALRALSEQPHPRMLLLDDGFQHRALYRDIDLLLLDGVRRWGNGRMLPRGNLREPMESAKRATALVVTRGSRAPKDEIEMWWTNYGSGGPVFYLDFAISALRRFGAQEKHTLAGPLPLRVFPFCALGHPEAFYADLLLAGVSWETYLSFPDHHVLRPAQLFKIATTARASGAEALVCTEKDAVKFRAQDVDALAMPLYVAEQRVVGGEALLAFVRARLEQLGRTHP